MADETSDAHPDHAGDAEIFAFPGTPAADERHDGASEPSAGHVPLREVLGDVLRAERLGQGRTLAEVAEEAAVSLAYLSEIERGTKEVSSELLDAVVRSLGLDLADVLERSARRLRVGSQRRGPTMRLLAA